MKNKTYQRFLDRHDAGEQLAKNLEHYSNQDDVVVLALPRGGVVIGFEVAKKLNAPLDIFLVRKLGVPGHEELAMGAIASGGAKIFNDSVINSTEITPEEIDNVIKREQAVLEKRENLYRGNRKFTDLKNKTVILVDDGIATGASMRVAIEAIKKMGCNKIIAAAPVAPKDAKNIFENEADEFICLQMPEFFMAIGNWYENFSQTSDKEVISLLSHR